MKNKNIQSIFNIKRGQLVLHIEHGIGRYIGTSILEIRGVKTEYIVITYANNDKLYVPISSIELINFYETSKLQNQNISLHKLGDDSWNRKKRVILKQIKDTAKILLDIYAKRSIEKGFSFTYNEERYSNFCKYFPFELTVDQNKAMKEIIKDMCNSSVMDRLVCGDVGLGKTEIAMRAAFLAVENKKQVVVLVPTTLLAQQHFENFQKRFSNWKNIRINMLSRFRTNIECSEIIQNIQNGNINILIGTHKILQNTIQWSNLGLLIIDEEHRFGVFQKEKIKIMSEGIDVLTLSATPIPRTLNISISGMRDFSIISTPPPGRLSVKTFVQEYDSLVVRRAILHEISRKGQVYYLVHNIKKIYKVTNRLKKIVPEANIQTIHGKMKEKDLKLIMNEFHHKNFNVLVCTSIIETGMDISNVNTIIIERADYFGLAQLHQLRGRVGRSYRQAYAYLLIPTKKILNNQTKKRLESIANLESLGVGFSLAMQDLEMRGAGELLGKNQSGKIEAIGFTLYKKFLNTAIEKIKLKERFSIDDFGKILEIELSIPNFLPENYISNIETRLIYYKNIFNAEKEETISNLENEIINLFGALPEPAYFLIEIAKLRFLAKELGIQCIKVNENGGFIKFKKNFCFNVKCILSLLKKNPKIFSLNKTDQLKLVCDLKNYKFRLNYIKNILLFLKNS